ncbi:nuclear transport factor 2 family protein [Halomarina halobia]|uniref:Nuclear transport factor 2 family protein n=1 Tax=Halomarina halobia TaxID=3033386 RepID=A0ABD6AEK5_9EURY|nr:nuclear transport factor 2 family protein [Halomarina sp. PSR21]
MTRERRDQLIDAYFAAMDNDNFELVEPAISENIRFESASGSVSSLEGFREYTEESRMISDSVHEVTRRIHAENASVCEGNVRGQTPEGPIEGAFCDVFEFDDDEERVTRISVYTRM